MTDVENIDDTRVEPFGKRIAMLTSSMRNNACIYVRPVEGWAGTGSWWTRTLFHWTIQCPGVSWCGSGSFPPRWSRKYRMLSIIDAWRLPWLRMENYFCDRERMQITCMHANHHVSMTLFRHHRIWCPGHCVWWDQTFPPCWWHRYLMYVLDQC